MTSSSTNLLDDHEQMGNQNRDRTAVRTIFPPPPLSSSSSYFAIPEGITVATDFFDSGFLRSSNTLLSPTADTFSGLGAKWGSKEEEANLSGFSFQNQTKAIISSSPSSVPICQPSAAMLSAEGSVHRQNDEFNSELLAPYHSLSSGNEATKSIQSNQGNYPQPCESIREHRRSEDGYNWRKYGQKQVKGSENPRSYYKCTHPNCPTTKKVEKSLADGHITEIVYKGSHNHPKPRSPRRSSHHLSLENSPVRIEADRCDKSFSMSKARGEDDYEAKRWKGENEMQGSASFMGSRTVKEPVVVLQTTSDIDILDDGYRWRKYGQKVVKGNQNPRSYYKCTSMGCAVRKHVERASDDPGAVMTTYEGKHNHDVPAPRGSAAHIMNGGLSSNNNNSYGNMPPVTRPTVMNKAEIYPTTLVRPRPASGPYYHTYGNVQRQGGFGLSEFDFGRFH